MERWYAARKQTHPQDGNRTPLTMGVLAVILSLLGFFLLFLSQARTDPAAYLAERPRVRVLDAQALPWRFTAVPASWCDEGIAEGRCVTRLPDASGMAALPAREFPSLAAFADSPSRVVSPPASFALFETQVTRRHLGELADFMTVALSLPGFRYYEARVFVDGVKQRSVFLNRRVSAVLEPQLRARDSYRVSVLLTPSADQKDVWTAPANGEPAFLATLFELDAFEAHLAVSLAGRGAWVGVLTKVVLAIFVLLLFLIIDGSPESLGLALSMGMDAMALMVQNRWVPLPGLDGRNDVAAAEFFRQLALVFHAYFICQLARVAPKAIGPWFAAAVPWALALAACRWFGTVNSVHGESWAWPAWTLAAAVVPAVIAAAGFAVVFAKGLPWRSLALGLAALASFLKVAAAGLALLNLGGKSEAAAFVVNVLNPNSSLLFVLSAFFNISTLEQRVRNQSRALAEAKEMENELAIGRKVQESLLRIPALPPAVGFAYFSRPQAYVSGDTFFVALDEARQRMSVVLTDITGHGIQAALKASACQTIAMTVWQSGPGEAAADGDAGQGARIRLFHERASRYLTQGVEPADVPAMTAIELDYATGALTCFRANYLSPILIHKRDGAPSPAPGRRVVYSSDGGLAPAARHGSHPVQGERRGDERRGSDRRASGRDPGDAESASHEPTSAWGNPGRGDDAWVVRALTIGHETTQTQNLPVGAFILLVSDGLIDSSTACHRFMRALRGALARESGDLDATRLKAILMRMPAVAAGTIKDDKTFLLLQWRPDAASPSREASHFRVARPGA